MIFNKRIINTHINYFFSNSKNKKWGCFILYAKAKFLKFILACNLNFYLKISFFYMWFKMTLLFSSLHRNVKMFCVTLKWIWMKQKYLQYANVDFMMLQILLSVIQMLVYIWLQLLLFKVHFGMSNGYRVDEMRSYKCWICKIRIKKGFIVNSSRWQEYVVVRNVVNTFTNKILFLLYSFIWVNFKVCFFVF